MTDVTRPTRPDLSCDDVRELAASFVLGALEEDDADAVRAHLASCADPHTEFAELSSVVGVLAETVPLVEPPAALKGRIMAAAAADLAARGGGAAQSPVAVRRPIDFPAEPERRQRLAFRAGTGSWLLSIAAVLAIALLGGWNLLLQGQLSAARTYEQNIAAVLDVAGEPGALTAVLTSEGANGPAGLAAIAGDGSVRIAMRELLATSGTQVYEAWVIAADGVPKALGGFRVGETGVAYFEGGGLPAQEGIVLALTLEPGPGATAPSSPLVSAGTVVGAGAGPGPSRKA
ncbi:MAG: anti-sigma factor [Chloroflexi bacterium]|nr:anti-sigma factor [Chloroflexota bacterium]